MYMCVCIYMYIRPSSYKSSAALSEHIAECKGKKTGEALAVDVGADEGVGGV